MVLPFSHVSILFLPLNTWLGNYFMHKEILYYHKNLGWISKNFAPGSVIAFAYKCLVPANDICSTQNYTCSAQGTDFYCQHIIFSLVFTRMLLPYWTTSIIWRTLVKRIEINHLIFFGQLFFWKYELAYPQELLPCGTTEILRNIGSCFLFWLLDILDNLLVVNKFAPYNMQYQLPFGQSNKVSTCN